MHKLRFDVDAVDNCASTLFELLASPLAVALPKCLKHLQNALTLSVLSPSYSVNLTNDAVSSCFTPGSMAVTQTSSRSAALIVDDSRGRMMPRRG